MGDPTSPPPTRPLRVTVLADTHLAEGRPLPAAVADAAAAADVVLHAGDVTSRSALRALAGLAPVHAVLGNNDRELVGVLPERLEIELAGVRVALVHDAGPRAGREARVHRWFPDADLVVFGHSHEHADHEGVDGQRLLNPGSPTQRRRQPHPTLARLELCRGEVLSRRIEVVTPVGVGRQG